MTNDPAAVVARAVLYEGYVLWPYRRSALKNQRRWTFGCVLPRSWSEDGHPDDAWRMRTECLVEEWAHDASLRVRARFLQVVRRDVARVVDGTLEPVDEIEVDGARWSSWEEAREREVVALLPELRHDVEARVPIRIRAGSERDWLEDRGGERAAAVVRSWREARGELRVRCAADRGALRVTAEVVNQTAWSGSEREDALRSALVSTHFVLEASGARFASLTDPPDLLREAAEACTQDGCWPVLVGVPGSSDRLLASPIVLPDHPSIAPESPGDLFDSGEIDEMLTLHVLALTDREKEEMRATDPRTREILERTSGLAEEQILRLHGARRDGVTGAPLGDTPADPPLAADRPRRPDGGREPDAPLAEDAPDPFWRELGRPADQRVVVEGLSLVRGSRVRLRPRRGGDVMDVVLAGRTAIVEGIDEDDAGAVHVAVVIEDDPGVDLGMARMPGHRFFFRPEEIEPIREVEA